MFVRKDLPLADQIVQTAHATHESGANFGCPENCHLVLFSVKNEEQLLNSARLCEMNNFKFKLFFEPDPLDDSDKSMGYTALCTEPLYNQKNVFKKYQIWK